MSLLGGFEQRLERAVEGFFARVFRSGVHPVEIGKRLLRVMEDGKTVGLRRVYAPNVFRITLSHADYERLSPLEAKLVEELEIFVTDAAKQRGWVLADTPAVSFDSAPRLSPGEFRISAEAVAVPASKPRTPAPVGAPTVAADQQRTQRMGTAPASLAIVEDGKVVRTIPLTGRVRMGRQADNDLVLPDPGISRHHAEVVQRSGEYLLRDLGSTNGTTVGGEQIDEHRLRDGDRFVLGSTVVEFRKA